MHEQRSVRCFGMMRCRGHSLVLLLLSVLAWRCSLPVFLAGYPGRGSGRLRAVSTDQLILKADPEGQPSKQASSRGLSLVKPSSSSDAAPLAASGSGRRGVLAMLLGAGLVPMREAWAEEVYTFNAEERQNIDLFEKNSEGVVFIESEIFGVSENPEGYLVEKIPTGSGTGWVYDTEGHIVTNYHVIQGASALGIRLADGTQLSATVVGADPGSDVAVLEVRLPEKKTRVLPAPLVAGTSSTLRVGQEVYAIGNPFGLDSTLTKGIVSGVGRTIMSVGGRPIAGAIQTDASINPGNSGGPLLNSKGQVVGMNTVIISPSGASAGVGFAIPSDTVLARVRSILKYGYVKRPSLGILLGRDGLARKVCGKEGVLVARVQPNGAGATAGIRSLDVIVKIDNKAIKKVNDVFAELDLHEPGESVQVQVLRSQDPDLALTQAGSAFNLQTISVKLQESSKQ